jgi:hypothetical protein
MVINHTVHFIASNGREYRLGKADLSNLLELAAHLKVNEIHESRNIKTENGYIIHTYDEIIELAKTALRMYRRHINEQMERLYK